jgi:hypothetical protein
MATQPPRTPTREEQRRLSIRTLAIASTASAAAAVVTSTFWVHGTWIAAAMTPVIVAVVSEMLNRPTEAVARRITTNDRAAIQRPAPGSRERPGPEPEQRPVTVYSSGGGGRSRTRKFALGLVGTTAALGFLIGGLALTVPELILGRSIGHRDRGSTLIPKKKHKRAEEKTPQNQQTTPTETQTEQQTTPTETQPEKTTPTQTQTQPTTPAKPAPGKQPGEPAP